MNSSAVSSFVLRSVAMGRLQGVRVLMIGSDGSGHGFELDDRPVLLLGKVIAAVLDVNMVPGQDFLDRALALTVKLDINAEIVKGLQPEFGVEVLRPGVEPGPAPPGLLDRG